MALLLRDPGAGATPKQEILRIPPRIPTQIFVRPKRLTRIRRNQRKESSFLRSKKKKKRKKLQK